MIKRISRLRPAALGAVAALSCLASTPAQGQDFDYFVLSLSWSPSWCAGDADRADEPQCAPERDLGFMLHGLWPQYEAGGWPEYCRTVARDPSRGTTASMADIMGSGGLAWHQWKKHGRCTGLSAQDYFETARFAYALLELPAPAPAATSADIVNQIVAANPGLRPEHLVVTCRGAQIRELRICLTPGLAPRACAIDVRDDACRRRGPLDVPDPP